MDALRRALGEATAVGVDALAALEDAWLLRLFPGRTLEELDGVDMRRLRAARDAQRAVDVELKRQGFLRGEVEDLTGEEWEMVRDVERVMNDE